MNAAIGYITESQSEQTIHALKSLVHPSALTRHDGQTHTVRAAEIVPGDILILRPGSYVTADARLLESQRLSVDESALTGESLPVTKHTTALTEANVPLADRHNMFYAGTLVTGGQGLAAVVATGQHTEMGQIQALVDVAASPDTPMERQLNQMGRQLVLLSGAVCGLMTLLLRWWRSILTSVWPVSAAIPAHTRARRFLSKTRGLWPCRPHGYRPTMGSHG